MCAAVVLRKAKPHVVSAVSSLLLEASAPRAVCCGSAEHLRLSDKGGGGEGGRWGVGTASEGGQVPPAAQTRSGCSESCCLWE